MTTLVVHESMFGNTRTIAMAIAEALPRPVVVTCVAEAPHPLPAHVDLLVVGGPTHAFSMSRSTTRHDAVAQGAATADEERGIREWLGDLPPDPARGRGHLRHPRRQGAPPPRLGGEVCGQGRRPSADRAPGRHRSPSTSMVSTGRCSTARWSGQPLGRGRWWPWAVPCEPPLVLSGATYSRFARRRDCWSGPRMAIRTAAPESRPPAGHDGPPATDDLHPALDASIEPREPRGSGLDKVVFGVTALIAVGFLVWGLVSTASLSSASERGPGVDDDQHRVDLRADRVGVRRVRDLAGDGPVRQHPAGPRRRAAGVPDGLVDRDDVQRRDGHRPDVLRRQRAGEPLRHSPARDGCDRQRADRDGHHALPLDAAPVGDLRRRRPRDRVRHLPQGPRPADQRRLRAAPRLARPRPRRQGHRHARDLRDALRLGRLARPRRPADPQRPGDRRRHRRRRQHACSSRSSPLLTVAFVLSAVSGVAKGIQWLSNINMVLALVLAAFVFVVGPTVFMLNLLPTALGSYAGQLPEMAARTGAEGAAVERVARRLDRLLLGLVALVDARSWACSSPASRAAAPSASSSPACCWCRAW